MERHVVHVALAAGSEDSTPTVRAPWTLLEGAGLRDGETCTLRFGLAETEVLWRANGDREGDSLLLSAPVAQRLQITGPVSLTFCRSGSAQIALGPLVGLLISSAKRDAVLNGKRDHVYCRYARAARETGGLLLFFAPDDLDLSGRTISGYLHHCDGAAECQWMPLKAPLPRVIYDRCFGKPGRMDAAALRMTMRDLGAVVVNAPVKITKLQAFQALQPPGDLGPHLPGTGPLTAEFLHILMETNDDLYVKPDALYKGKGVCRLKRVGSGWEIWTREEGENRTLRVADEQEVLPALSGMLEPDVTYVVQEGLPLAAYLGNRFDLRSLVQRAGDGKWQVTGVVARIAPEGSAITSPRSGGQIAPIESALQYAFGPQATAIRAEIDRVSLALAERIDQRLGPCVELGLDLGVLEDGRVMLIEVNGIPLRVSLERLRDPLIGERIDRFPIHFAAYLDMQE